MMLIETNLSNSKKHTFPDIILKKMIKMNLKCFYFILIIFFSVTMVQKMSALLENLSVFKTVDALKSTGSLPQKTYG